MTNFRHDAYSYRSLEGKQKNETLRNSTWHKINDN